MDGYRNISGHPDAVTIRASALPFRCVAAFFNADYFKSRVRAVVAAAQPKPRWLVIDAGTIAYSHHGSRGPRGSDRGSQSCGSRGRPGRGREIRARDARADGPEPTVGTARMFPTI